MPDFDINFDDAVDYSELWPEGRYVLAPADPKPAKRNDKGNLRKLIGFEVMEAPEGVEIPPKKMVWEGYNLHGEGAGFLRDLLRAMQLDPEAAAACKSDQEFDDLIMHGESFEADVEVNTWEGRERNRIARVFPHD